MYPPKVTPISGFAASMVQPPIHWAGEYASKRGLKPETLEAAGWRLVTLDDLFTILGNNRAVWSARKAGYTCAFYFPANGDPSSKIFRARLLGSSGVELPPAVPKEDVKAFKGKYLGMTKELNALYQPPTSVIPYNPEPHDVWIVEGAGNALRLAQDGIDAVGIPGVDSWRLKDKSSPVIPELLLKAGAENAKRVIIGFDSDAQFNQKMQVSLNGLALELLKHRPDAQIYLAYPPPPEDGGKYGWDDFLQIKGRAAFDEQLRTNAKRWDDNPFIRKCIEWQRYILIESEGRFFDTHPHVFASVDSKTADLAMSNGSRMLNPMSHRVEMINFNHNHYLDSSYALRAKHVEMHPDIEKVHFKDRERNIWVVNNYRFDLLPQPVKGDVSWWYEILDNITRDSPSAKDKFLKLAARKVQYPTEHFPLAIGIIGDQGAGKSLFALSLGVCVGSYSGGRVNMRDTDNSSWAGALVREWPEINPDMDTETWKQLIRDTYQDIRKLYSSPRRIPSRTLHIATNNKIKQMVEKGDRAMIFAGYGKRLPDSIGYAAAQLIGSVEKPGPGIAALRYHLLYEVNSDGVETMGNQTEIQGEIIAASATRQEDVLEEILMIVSDIPELEILPSSVMNGLLEKIGYKGNFMSLRKSIREIGTPGLPEGVKIDGVKTRFCVLKNLDYWRKETDPDKYRTQYKLAYPLINGKSKF